MNAKRKLLLSLVAILAANLLYACGVTEWQVEQDKMQPLYRVDAELRSSAFTNRIAESASCERLPNGALTNCKPRK